MPLPAGPGPPTRSATPTPPTVRRGGGARTTSSRGEGGGNGRGGPELLPPALAGPPPHPPRGGEQGAQAKACTRIWHPKGGGGQGEGVPPPSAAGPPGTGTTRPPGDQGGTAGNHPSPPPSPPPWRADSRRPAREAAAPQPPLKGPGHPGGGRHSRGERSPAPGAPNQPPTHSPSACCLPAALRQRSRVPRGPQRHGSTQICSMGANEATRLVARPW